MHLLISYTYSGRSVGIVRSRTQTMEFVLFYSGMTHVSHFGDSFVV
jgi:hypothetical protein